MGPEGSSVDVPSGAGEATGGPHCTQGRGCGSSEKRRGGGLQHFSISLGLCLPNFFVWICFCGPGATGTFVPDSLFPRLGEGAENGLWASRDDGSVGKAQLSCSAGTKE